MEFWGINLNFLLWRYTLTVWKKTSALQSRWLQSDLCAGFLERIVRIIRGFTVWFIYIYINQWNPLLNNSSATFKSMLNIFWLRFHPPSIHACSYCSTPSDSSYAHLSSMFARIVVDLWCLVGVRMCNNWYHVKCLCRKWIVFFLISRLIDPSDVYVITKFKFQSFI